MINIGKYKHGWTFIQAGSDNTSRALDGVKEVSRCYNKELCSTSCNLLDYYYFVLKGYNFVLSSFIYPVGILIVGTPLY